MIHPVYTLVDYQFLAGINNGNNTGLDDLKRALAEELRKKDSGFGKALSQLSEENKARIIAALIANNSAIIVEMLSPLLSALGLGTSLPYLSQITQHPPGSENWLSPTVGLLIKQMLWAEVNEAHALSRSTRILKNAMQQIPETLIHIKPKVSISREIDYSAAQAISDYSYNESLEPLKKNRFSGKITLNEFKAALKAPSLDFSEFTLLSLGTLQNLLGDRSELQQDFNQIRQLYLMTEYEKSIAKMKELASKHQSLVGNELLALMTNRSSQLSEVAIYKNYSRRFFENRLSQLHSGQTQGLESINRIARALIGKAVNTAKEAETAILSISELEDKSSAEHFQSLITASPLFKLHDRVDKSSYSDKGMECHGIVVANDVWSRNKGVLTSTAHNFYDELSENSMRNRIVDTSATCEDETLYSYSRPRSVFAASLSGHSFHVVSVLECFMKEEANAKNLQTDINIFIKWLISIYLSRGYHSFFEVTDVFREPPVQKLFAHFKLSLDLSWQDAIVEKAARDTQEYTKAICMRKALGNSMLGFFSKRESGASQGKREVQNTLHI